MPKKPPRKDPTSSGTNFLDYPESMSMYERESLAADATLAEREKAKPKKEKKKTNRVRVVPPKNVHPTEANEE